MAITNFVEDNPAQKVRRAAFTHGDGAPASTDKLVTDVTRFPKGTYYYDTTNFILHIRHAEAGATTDFKATAALT